MARDGMVGFPMARTAPVPDIPPIPGMNPGVIVAGGGGGSGGGGGGDGSGSGGNAGADGENGGESAEGDGQSAQSCGQGTGDGSACPNHHGGGGASGSTTAGDPIDVVTGRVFTRPFIDLRLPGPLPLVVAHSYSSHARNRDVGLGFGWTHSFAWEIRIRGTTATLFTSTGDTVDLGPVLVGQGNVGPNGWILHPEGDGLALDMPRGKRRLFERTKSPGSEQQFRLTAIEDRHGNRLDLEYRDVGLESIVDSTGRIVRLVAGEGGRIREVGVLAGGGSFVMARFAYDGRGQLVSTTDADGNVTHFGYDEGGEHLLVWYELPTRFRFHFRYDAQGRGVESWGAFRDGPDPALSARASALLADGVRRAKGSQHVVVDYGDKGFRDVVDASTTLRGEGNAFGKLDRAVVAGQVYTREYDALGYLRSFTDPLGATTVWERDVFGNETRVTDPLGAVTEIERWPGGNIRRVTDELGGVTEVTYTRHSIAWDNPIKAHFELEFDGQGMETRAVAPDGTVVDYQRDAASNVVAVRIGGVTREEATYDALGRRVAVRNALGHATTFRRSAKGLVLERCDPGDARWIFGYDGAGRLIEVRDPRGRRTGIVRGGSGLAADVERPDGSIVRFRFDRNDRLLEVLGPGGETHTIERDPAGLPIVEQTFDGRVLRHRYDAAGRLIATSFGNGDVVEIERDLCGRVVQRTCDEEEESFVYDARGDVVGAVHGDCGVELVRNAVGWIVREVQTLGGDPVTVEVDYDSMGHVIRRRTSLGHVLERVYEPGTGTVRSRLDGADTFSSQLDAEGREVTGTLPGGGTIHTAYDEAGRIRRRSVASAYPATQLDPRQPPWVGAPLSNLTCDTAYSYNPAGELASQWDAVTGTATYEHDALGRLTRVAPERGPGESFWYGPSGELYEGESGNRRRYEPGGRLADYAGVAYKWDERGRIVERCGKDGEVTRYAWLVSGLLESVALPDGTVVAFLYDAFARRTKKTVSRLGADGSLAVVAETRFIWDGTTLVHAVTTHPGQPRRVRTFVFEDSEAPRAHKDDDGPWLWYVTDQVGAPRRLVNGEGSVVTDVVLSAWGQAIPEPGGEATPIRFVGQYADGETGLHYVGYRYYDPAIGRFLSPDPLGLAGGLDPYAYAENQPTGLVDLDGLVYTRIVNPNTDPPTVLHEGYNTDEGRGRDPAHGGAIPTTVSDKPCAEAQALQRMHNDTVTQINNEQRGVRVQDRLTPEQVDAEAKRRMKNQFDEQGLQMETFQEKGGPRVDPCARCGQMIRDLGIQDHVVGAKGKVGKFGVYRKPKGY
ncbi:MAG: RHS repeat protein [Polyangiaceae bacterium]|nr:RHS repeat protein [Polyangiaceae bacterium]